MSVSPSHVVPPAEAAEAQAVARISQGMRLRYFAGVLSVLGGLDPRGS